MPVHSSYTVRWGSSGRSLLLFSHDRLGRGVVGLSHLSPGARASFVREGESPRQLVMEEGSFTEVDPDLMPGVYRLRVPDDLFHRGAPHALVLVGFDECSIDPIEIELVAYDPQDASCLGMEHLQDRKRHEFLRRALPNLTEMEFEAGLDREKKLSDFLAERGG